MQVRRSIPIQRLVLVIGLGLTAIAGLLCWADQRASTVRASVRLSAALSPTGYGGVSPNWGSTTPVTKTVYKTGTVWPIPQHGVTVTFPVNSLDGTAVFTFTPKTGYSSSPPGHSSYFFDLRGVYSGTDIGVSMKNKYDIALQYDPSELGGAQEHSLRMFNFDVFYGRWEPQTTSVDSAKKIVYCTTLQTGMFALAGYSDQTFLPVVLRNY